MIPKELEFGPVRIQLLSQGERLDGLGAIGINSKQVRSPTLPLRPFGETVLGLRFDEVRYLGHTSRDGGLDIHTRWLARDSSWEVRLDHSLDRIINTGSWDGSVRAEAELDILLRPARLEIDGRRFEGFSYAFRYRGEHPIFLIVDRSTWEIGGRISGCSYYGQLNFSSPTATYTLDSEHTSEGLIDFPLNPVMTHALPRWAGGPTVDYLFRGNDALVLFYDRVALIRSVMKKNRGEDHLKFLEQHYLDHNTEQLTSARHVLLDSSAKSEVDHKNLWTRWHDYTSQRARDEFGMREPLYPIILAHNFWLNFDFTSYDKDLLPAAAALDVGQVFIDPVWENDMTKTRSGALVNRGNRMGNMCCPWELEVADVLGGIDGLKSLVQRCHAFNIQCSSWIGTHVSDVYFDAQNKESYCVVLPDGRHQYGSGYDSILGMDLNSAYTPYFLDRLEHVRKATGIDGYLYDSFFNFGFMPVTFHDMRPRTQVRACAQIMARLQQMGYEMRIESLGPFGQNSHGVGAAYRENHNEFIRYKGHMAPGYSTIPTPNMQMRASHDAKKHFRLVSGKSQLDMPLFIDKQRIDQIADPMMRLTNSAYKKVQQQMGVRTLLEDDGGAIWRNADGRTTTCWTFKPLSLKVPAGTTARCLFTGQSVNPRGDSLSLQPYHVYEWKS